jgi:hypothetical protein
MKRFKAVATIIIACLGIIAPLHAAADDNAQPSIEFSSRSHDFGTVKEKNGIISHTFTFTNTGTAPLVIISAKASCGCTEPSFQKRPIQPGEHSNVVVKYNPAGRPGEFDKTVTLQTNVKGRGRKVTLRITGTVIPQ